MRIAQIAPIIERVPPKKYGGSERVVYELTEELVRRGHDVTLFASGDSITSARLVSVYPKALREAVFDEIYAANHMATLNVGVAYERHLEFDIIHDHNWTLSLPTANVVSTPVVLTHHGPFFENVNRLFAALTRPYVVGISRAQIQAAPPGANIAGYVYNGLAMEHYPFSHNHDGYLLWVGRIDAEKSPHLAIEVAERVGLPLILAGKYEPGINRAYFEEKIAPKLADPHSEIVWLGEVDEAERNTLMAHAAAVMHPISWPEPFGLTMIEAMACGAPVIATPLGSVPEIVIHRKTGFIAYTVEAMAEAVQNIATIDRKTAREHALGTFSAKRMADGYEALYRQILMRVEAGEMLASPSPAVVRESKRRGKTLFDKDHYSE